MDGPMPHVKPDPLPTRWGYTLRSNFVNDGAPAEWAQGRPRGWASEDKALFIDSGVIAASLSQDDRVTAVACLHTVEILENTGDEPRRLSIHSTPQDWTVGHVEWFAVQNDRQPKHHVVVCFVSPQPAPPGEKRDACTQVYCLDGDAWSINAVPCLKFPCIAWPSRSHRMVDKTGERILILSRASDQLEGGARPTNRSSEKVEVRSISDSSICCALSSISNSTSWLGFSSDSSIVGVASSDRILRLLDANSGDVKWSSTPLDGQINAGAFSSDGSKIALTCSSTNASVKVFETCDGKQLLSLPFHQITRSLAWSPDSKILAYGAQGGFLQLFDWTLGRVIQNWHLDYSGVRPSPLNEPSDIQFVDDGHKLMFSTGMEGGVEVYDMQNNSKQRFEPTSECNYVRGKKRSSIAWSSAHRSVLTVDGDGYLRFWKL